MNTPTDPCEDFLCAEKTSFLGQRIWPSKVVIIDRLLADSLNLLPVYAELRRRLPDPAHWTRVLEIAVIFRRRLHQLIGRNGCCAASS